MYEQLSCGDLMTLASLEGENSVKQNVAELACEGKDSKEFINSSNRNVDGCVINA